MPESYRYVFYPSNGSNFVMVDVIFCVVWQVFCIIASYDLSSRLGLPAVLMFICITYVLSERVRSNIIYVAICL